MTKQNAFSIKLWWPPILQVTAVWLPSGAKAKLDGGARVTLEELSARLARKGKELGVRVEIQREEIFKAMHRI